ncbi:MAG TPA: rod shape-determining protein MreC [Terriglobales bacterium]
MESFLSRFRNVIVLVIVLSAQTVLLATQIKRPKDSQKPEAGTTRLIRLWAVEIFVPVEHAFTATGHFFSNGWHSYIDLRGVRQQNQELQHQLDLLRLQQVRLAEDAGQARRLQALLAFREQYISQTVAAQVVGTSGTDRSRVFFIDKGSSDGLKADMPVISPAGIVGKINKVFPNTAQVLAISDSQSGAGVMLEKSRIRGVLRGTARGFPEITKSVMSDEKVERGERVLTSGGDQIYPRGMEVGIVDQVLPDRDGEPFLTLRVRPSADLNRLEEVLVITKVEEKQTEPSDAQPKLRASDILAERLPKVSPKPPEAVSPNAQKTTPGTAVLPGVLKPAPPPGTAASNAPKTTVPGSGNGVKLSAKPPLKTVNPAATATGQKAAHTPKVPQSATDNGTAAETSSAGAATTGTEPKEPKTNPAAASGASQAPKGEQQKQDQPPKSDASATEVPK